MASGLGAFAQGMVNGYITGKKMQQAQELHDLQVKELKRKSDMRDAIAAASADVKPAPVFTVTDPTGGVSTYADKAAADEAAKGYGDGASVATGFSVAGKTYTDQKLAGRAASLENTPIMRNQRLAGIAMNYGDPQLAAAYASAADTMANSARNLLYNDIQNARQTGDYQRVVDEYNATHSNGGKISLVGAPGSFTLRTTLANGQTVDKPVGSLDNFFNLASDAAMNSSANAMAIRQLKQQKELADARNQVTERGQDLSHSAAMASVGVASQRAGIARDALDWSKSHPGKPLISSGVDAQGNTAFTANEAVRGKDGNLTVVSTPLHTVPGMKPVRYGTGMMGLGGFGGGATPSDMVGRTNFGGAGAPVAKTPSAAPAAQPTPQPPSAAPAAPIAPTTNDAAAADGAAYSEATARGYRGLPPGVATHPPVDVPYDPNAPYYNNGGYAR